MEIVATDHTQGHIKDYKRLRLEFDGSCEPINPGGIASIGWLIFDATDESPDEGILVEGGQVVADGGKLATNNFAEYCAIGVPLRWLLDQGWRGTIDITGDSKLVVEQTNKKWKCNAEHLKKLRQRVWDVLDELELELGNTATLIWVPREENERADELGRKAYAAYCTSRNRPVKYMRKRK